LKEINIITHIAFTSKGKKPGGILYLFWFKSKFVPVLN
jgi:hypothetical protein